MGDKKEKNGTFRVPFNINLENPEHRRINDILERQENKNAFIREAILFYSTYGISDSLPTRDDIRKIAREVGEEMTGRILSAMEERDSAENDGKPQEKSQMDFDRLKNLF